VENLEALAGPRCATVSGVSVHANICVPAHDRMRLEWHSWRWNSSGNCRVARCT
jgi:hypothetical protein